MKIVSDYTALYSRWLL